MMIIGIDPFIVYGAIAVCLIFLLRRRLWLPSRYGRWLRPAV
jgi:hypothetical protein